MSSMTDYLENKLAEHLMNGIDFTVSGIVYVALFSGATTDALTSGGEAQGELVTSGYARVLVTSGWTIPASVASNTASVEFPEALEDWGTISHVAIFDTLTSGNGLLHAALSGSKDIDNGDVARFNAGTLTVTFD